MTDTVTLAKIWDRLEPIEQKYFLVKHGLHPRLRTLPWLMVMFTKLDDIVDEFPEISCDFCFEGKKYHSKPIWLQLKPKLRGFGIDAYGAG